jgi:hypothetical protein
MQSNGVFENGKVDAFANYQYISRKISLSGFIASNDRDWNLGAASIEIKVIWSRVCNLVTKKRKLTYHLKARFCRYSGKPTGNGLFRLKN